MKNLSRQGDYFISAIDYKKWIIGMKTKELKEPR